MQQQQQRQQRFQATYQIPPRDRSCNLVIREAELVMHDITGPFILCSIVCATSEPFISFTHFSQIHPYEYVKGKLCGMLFPLEKTGCGLIKINPFDLHLVLNNTKSF